MRAVVWHGRLDVRVEDVPEPKLLNPRDAIIRVTAASLCEADLHLYERQLPGVRKGNILGHEFTGEVVETGPGVRNLRPGDRVVVPFVVACGECWFCREGLTAFCDNSNPDPSAAEKEFGFPAAGVFGYTHFPGGYPGGQAGYVRVPFADFGPMKVPDDLTEEQVLLLSADLPTGWMAAENCHIRPGDVVAVFGCGPVGQLAILSARRLGAHKVLALDVNPARLRLAAAFGGAETLNAGEFENVAEELKRRTGGRGPDACIDAAGMGGHGFPLDAIVDRARQAVHLEGGRPVVLRTAIQACRKGGTVSIPGFYSGAIDQVPVGSAFAKGLTLRLGPVHVHRYLRPLLQMIEEGTLDPARIITHRFRLEEAGEAYRVFSRRDEAGVKAVLIP